MFARILLAGIVAALLVAPAHAQAWRTVLSEIGASPAAREVAASVARRSDLALKVMEGLGFKVGSEAAAVQQWRLLSAEQLGAVITRDEALTRQFLASQRLTMEDRELWYSGINMIRKNRFDVQSLGSQGSSTLGDPSIACSQFCRSMLRDAGVTGAVSSTVPLSTYIDALLKKQQ